MARMVTGNASAPTGAALVTRRLQVAGLQPCRQDHPHPRVASAIEQPAETDEPMARHAHADQVGRRDLPVRRIVQRTVVRLRGFSPAAASADPAGAL